MKLKFKMAYIAFSSLKFFFTRLWDAPLPIGTLSMHNCVGFTDLENTNLSIIQLVNPIQVNL